MRNSLFVFCFVFSVVAYAQSLQVSPVEAHVSSEDLWLEMVTEVVVENSSANDLNVKVRREILTAPLGTSNYFCWDVCYPSNTGVSSGEMLMSSGEINETSFSVHFVPEGTEGEAIIRYCAFNADNEADSACTIVYFNGGVSSIDKISQTSFSDFHPNPTSSETILNYQFSPSQHVEVIFVDMMGVLVKKHQLLAGDSQLKVSVSDLKAGLYFANIMVDGQLHEVKRLIVSE